MCCFLTLDKRSIIYGLITLWVVKILLLFFFKQRAALNQIIITNESRSMIEVEQSLKAGTIKGFKTCRRISTFLISHSRRGTKNHRRSRWSSLAKYLLKQRADFDNTLRKSLLHVNLQQMNFWKPLDSRWLPQLKLN